MGHRKLPPELQVRVHEYYEYKYKGKMFDEEVILEELNDCLREVSSKPFRSPYLSFRSKWVGVSMNTYWFMMQ